MPQELANTAWAFATANHRDETLFAALARWGCHPVGELNAQHIQTAPCAFWQRENSVVSWSPFPRARHSGICCCAFGSDALFVKGEQKHDRLIDERNCTLERCGTYSR